METVISLLLVVAVIAAIGALAFLWGVDSGPVIGDDHQRGNADRQS